MTLETVLITQPKSAMRDDVRQAVQSVREQGHALRVLLPYDPSDSDRLIREVVASGTTRIIAGGGDGTLNAVANALMNFGNVGRAVEMGVLPLGTANDFARGIDLPLDDLGECLRIACTAQSSPIDLGIANGRYFVNVASLGFGSEITATTPVGLKWVLGGAAYSLVGFVKAMNMQPYNCTISVPGEEPMSSQMLFLAVGNNKFAGGGYSVSPMADFRDGKLDLSAITVSEGFSIAKLQAELAEPENPSNQFIQYHQLTEFTLSSDTELHCNLDGEPTTALHFDFSIAPLALRLVGA